ncbi:HPP family protein [Actimicrobium antarcticum]|uniref:HPP family protein n=1 Tax=Actimicrobium antarcticum TaxID=1051899 RepID=A0ABP7SSV0_9BURK
MRSFIPVRVGVNGTERLRACGGALLGILITGLVMRWTLGPDIPVSLLIAPMGASAVLLFALPSSPLAQPWSIMGGNLVSATIGVACAVWIADPVWAATAAIALAIAAMLLLGCLHPPSGAIALTAVLGGPAIHAQGFAFVLAPVGLNSLLILLVAIAYNNATRRRYPHLAHPDAASTHDTRDASPMSRVGFTSADLDHVLRQFNEVLDINRDDLADLLRQTEMQAYRRRFGEVSCADIMSRDLITVEFGSTLNEAWTQLHAHRIKALPVLDRARRVIGIVTLADFFQHANLDGPVAISDKLRALLRRSPASHSDKPEVVGQIMTKAVRTATMDQAIVELVPLFSDSGLHHIPVIDEERRLCGMVTQSDLVAALYRGRLDQPLAAA